MQYQQTINVILAGLHNIPEDFSSQLNKLTFLTFIFLKKTLRFQGYSSNKSIYIVAVILSFTTEIIIL